MNNRALTLSLAMAALAVFFVQSYVQSVEEKAKKDFGTEVLVLFAKKDIGEMENLDETSFDLLPLPKRFMEPAAIAYESKGRSSEEVGEDLRRLYGSVALVPIKKGEQITYNKFTEPGLRTGLSPQVTPGKRAVSIPVSETSGVGKLLKPGDRVDVLAIVSVGQTPDAKMVKTLLQDVAVLAVGRNVVNGIHRSLDLDINGKVRTRSLTQYDGFSSVTLEVDPSQAQLLTLMQGIGSNTLSLTLRNNDDSERVPIGSASMNEVMGSDSARKPASPPQGGAR